MFSSLIRSSSRARIFLTLAGASLVAIAGLSAEPSKSAAWPKCCVWRVTNAKAPFYLVGSIHALSARDYPLPSAYEIAYRDSKRFLFEYDLHRDEEFGKKFETAGKYPPGQDIRSKVPPQALAWFRQHLEVTHYDYDSSKKKYRVTVSNFDSALQYRPWWMADHYFGVPGYSGVSYSKGVDIFI
jgi:hypothetical protein